MRRTLKIFCAIGLIAAFLVMATAMVLPHAHEAGTPHHVCWVCQAKAIGVSAPEVGPQPGPLHPAAPLPPPGQAAVYLQIAPLLSEARAPPVSSPVLP